LNRHSGYFAEAVGDRRSHYAPTNDANLHRSCAPTSPYIHKKRTLTFKTGTESAIDPLLF
jgi:hypothetical protein